MELYWTIVLFMIGITLGSFFNVVGLRVPQNIPFTTDRSHCPNCDTQLKWFELIPVFSYIFLFGKCRTCKKKISSLYPIVELLTGILFSFSYVKLGFSTELLAAIIFISLLMIVVVTDISYMLIPNKILLFFLPLIIVARIISPLTPWYDAIIGGVVGFLLIAIIILVSNGGMGAGDMKLLGIIGIILGWQNTLLTFFFAALLGAIVGGMLLLFKIIKRKQPIPFGPYIVIGALISYFYGKDIISLYLSLFFSL